VLAITLLRLIRRPGLYRIAIIVAVVAFVTDVILIVLGFAFLFSPSDLGHGAHPGVAPTWHSLAFALPVAMLAYTGLETLANLAQEAREPGKTIPRSLFVGLGAAVLVSALVGVVGSPRSRASATRARHRLDPGAAARDRLRVQGHMPAFSSTCSAC
jgi:amino acid transporter